LAYFYRVTKADIITALYQSKEFDRVLRTRIMPDNFPGGFRIWQEELKSEAFKILCETPDDTLLHIYRAGKINHFVGKIILNLSRQTRNVIYKNYVSNFIPLADYQDEEYSEINIDKVLENMMGESSALNYMANVVKQYSELGSLRALSAQTTIPVMSIHQSLKRARIIIKQKLNED